MKQLTTPRGTFAVYLNRIAQDSSEFCHLSFVDQENKLHIIIMQNCEEQWIIGNEFQLPQWIIDMKPRFVDIILSREEDLA